MPSPKYVLNLFQKNIDSNIFFLFTPSRFYTSATCSICPILKLYLDVPHFELLLVPIDEKKIRIVFVILVLS